MPENAPRPHALLMSEITTDGKLTLKRGASSKILTAHMDRAAQMLLHRTRAECDAIMVGSNTVRIDNPFLTVRMVAGRSPLRVVPNGMADIPADSHVLGGDVPTILAVAAAAPAERLDALRRRGVGVVVAGAEHVDLPLLMQRLWQDFGVRRLMVEGGPTLAWHLFRHRLLDEIRLIHLPLIVGGADTPSLVGGIAAAGENDMIRLVLKNHYLSGANLVTEHDVHYADGVDGGA